MSNLIRGEFYKLRKSKYFIVMIILAVIVGFFLTDMWSRDIERNVRIVHSSVDVLHSMEYAFNFIILSSFFFALLAGEFIAQDFKNNKLSNTFSYGYSRSKIILSKFIVFIIFSLFLEIIYLTIFIIYVSAHHGFCEVLNLSVILQFIRMIVVGIIFNLATISLLALIAVLTKSTYITIISPIFILISFGYYVHTGFSMHILEYMPYIYAGNGLITLKSEAVIIKSIISLFLSFGIAIGGSLLYVEHQDIK